MNNTIKENITQFFLIVFSVVLGLYLSERIEDRKEKQEAKDLLTTINSEVKDNTQLLEYWYPYHQEIYNNLDSLADDDAFIKDFINDKNIVFERLFTRSTFMGRRPANDAWEIAKSHPLIVKIDYDKYTILSRIYNQQFVTYESAEKMFELLFGSKDVNTEENAKANLDILSDRIKEFVAREKRLLSYYKDGQEILGLKDNVETKE